ncbi:Probable E3 ubiquitin-protein ligase ARI5 [Linum perenne]
MIVEANDGDATKASAGFSTIGKDDIERRLEGLIAEITSSLSVPRAPAVVLLVSNKWYSELVQENWFSDEEKMRRFLGLTMVASSSSAATEIYCKICWERISIPDFISLDCGHNFCNECWRQYIKVGVGDGIACLTLRCPEPKCYVLVPKSTVETLAESEDIEKYSRILRRSYIEGKPNQKWCPAPDCENAVIFDAVKRDDARSVGGAGRWRRGGVEEEEGFGRICKGLN